jgi:hypothetical protein
MKKTQADRSTLTALSMAGSFFCFIKIRLFQITGRFCDLTPKIT